MAINSDLGIVIIGRNEGERLVRCLASVHGQARVVYVDSGSTDESVAKARAAGADVVSLDLTIPFTAAEQEAAGHRPCARAKGAPCRMSPSLSSIIVHPI